MSKDQSASTLIRCAWLTDGPLAVVVSPYVSYLQTQRYSDRSINGYLASVAHLAYWMRTEGLRLPNLNEALVKRFLETHSPSCKCPRPCCHALNDLRSALRHLLIVLRRTGLLLAPTTEDETPIAFELERFRHHLIDTRGLTDSTCRSYLKYAGKFLLHYFGTGSLDISLLTVRDIERYVIDHAKRRSLVSLASIRSTLNAYLRFRASLGDQTQSLLAAVPHIANWAHAAIPKSLTEEELERVLQAFDLTKPMGKRNYAIARCLIDLGLRGIEVTHLQLDSLDWRAATITVAGGKGRQVRTLPLPAQTGRAIARYLRNGRPATNNRQLFVRHHAPFDKPITVDVIRNVVNRTLSRCALGEKYSGAHVLRHTVATRLQRHGASLKEIADLMGHQSLQTTTIYARADLQALRAVALPWPGSAS